MRLLSVALFILTTIALAGCQTATIGPRGGKHVLSSRIAPPIGTGCIAAWAEPESTLARDMAAAEPPVLCSNKMDDGGTTGALLRAGLTFERDGRGWSQTTGPGFMVELVLYDEPSDDMTPAGLLRYDAVDWSVLPKGGGQALDAPERTTVGGHVLQLLASAMPWKGDAERLVCVGAADVTTRQAWTRICRPTPADGALDTAANIIADDLPAVRVWPGGTWQAGA